jgi:hypothetical protein
MRDFNEYNSSIAMKQIESGKSIFKIQLKGVEGKDIEIDGKLTRGIILNHLNDMSTTKDQRGLNVELTTLINKGSYVRDLVEDKMYIVLSNVDNHYVYKTCTLEYCNQTLNWQGLDNPIPCWCDNSSYGTKGIIESNYLTEYDGKILFYIQYNDKTKIIKQDMRFLFDNDERSVYKVVDVNRVVTGNVLRLVMDKTEYNSEKDDVENNIAYNDWLDVTSTTPPIEGKHSIKSSIGIMQINRWDTNTFTILNEQGIEDSGVWDISIDYNGNPTNYITVKDKGNNYIKIMNNGFMGCEIKLKFTKGDISLVETVGLVK